MPSSLGSVWLPDFVAAWYDELLPTATTVLTRPNREVIRRARVADDQLKRRPSRAAVDLNGWINHASDHRSRLDRLHASLDAASRAIQDVGITRRLGGGDEWEEIRANFMRRGNLLMNASGFLLPGREGEFDWIVLPPIRAYDPRFAFPGFVRGIPQRFDVRVSYVSDIDIPIESVRRQLRVGVVPLIGDIHDFEWIPVNGDPPRFRVSIKRPQEEAQKAGAAIEEAGRSRCDIVLFPELCFDHHEQEAFGRAVAHATRSNGGYPWLVVAGSAYSPAGESESEHHNRAIVFDSRGRELLRYNKLHPYEFTMEEQGRYGVAPLLGATSRIEDIITLPPTVGILQTAIGRIAILICEDLWNMGSFLSLMQDLAVDWLLVPVLDGIQHENRWTARNAGFYAEHGTSVVVATSASLVNAHKLSLRNVPGDDASAALADLSYVGLLVTPSTTQRTRHFDMPLQPSELSILNV